MQREFPFLEMRGICKSFSHVRALCGVGLQVDFGEILAVIGDNGAGKSTLIKVLSGALRPDGGEISIEGKGHPYLTPKTAIASGISTVYQDLALAGSRDVAANIYLGREAMIGPFLHHRKMVQKAEELIDRLDIDLPDVRVPVSVLSGGQRQGVAVARAIHQGGKLFIFDEPTAAMGLRETARVQTLIQKLAADGYAVILISHNIQQVFELSNRILVLRHGSVAAAVNTNQTTVDETVAMITGAA